MARLTTLLALLVLAWFPRSTQALWTRSESVEWWTNVSDVVLVGDVTSAKVIEDDIEIQENHKDRWSSQKVVCKTTDVLKGKKRAEMAFRQMYLKDPKLWGRDIISGDRRLRIGDKVILFCARREPNKELEVGFWINLTKPDARRMLHSAYDNECKWLGDAESILSLVKKRISKENPADRMKKRGVTIGFTDRPEPCDETGFGWSFVRTADPEYKQAIVNELGRGDTESAIYNLISYPGKETVNLIKPFLNDPTKETLYKGKELVETPLYPLRQMAYYALKLLGESPEPPEGFVKDYFPFLIATGFEDRVYFPFGDWKRIERPEE